MNERTRKWLTLAAYPAAYFFFLAVFAYATFPYDRLRERILAEYEKAQPPGPGSQRLEIAEIGPYWLTGLRARGVKLIPAKDAEPAGAKADKGDKAEAAPKVEATELDEVHVRLRVLPLLIGRVSVGFGATAFGGSIDGVLSGGTDRHVQLTLTGVALGQVPQLARALGVPLRGAIDAHVDWTMTDEKLSKSTGTVEGLLREVVVGDGKATVAGLALPPLRVGDVPFTLEAKEPGIVKLVKLAASGQDLDLAAEGRVALRDVTIESAADVNLRFRLADAYRAKDDTTKSLFGAPGSGTPALVDLEPRAKQAKRPDGYYGFHLAGTLASPRFEAAPNASPGSSTTTVGGAPAAPGRPATRGFAN